MRNAIEKLSNLQLNKLAKKPGVYEDGGGLRLVVLGPTSKSWVYRYQLRGKRRQMGLGPYPIVTLAEARQKAAQARKLKVDGIDPLAHRESVRHSERLEEARARTFRECAEMYIKEMTPEWRNEKHAKQWNATLEAYVYPKIGGLPVAAVDVPLMREILSPIWSEKPTTARRVRGRIAAILDRAEAHEYRTGENPARRNLFPTSKRAAARRRGGSSISQPCPISSCPPSWPRWANKTAWRRSRCASPL